MLQLLRPPARCQRSHRVFCLCCHEPGGGGQVQPGDAGSVRVLPFPVLPLTWWAGGVGFILANCLNMGLRISHSLLYIHHYFQVSQWKPLRGLLPSPLLLLALGVSAVVTAVSEGVLCCDSGWLLRLVHVAVGAVCLLGVCGLFFSQRLVLFSCEDAASAPVQKKTNVTVTKKGREFCSATNSSSKAADNRSVCVCVGVWVCVLGGGTVFVRGQRSEVRVRVGFNTVCQ
ncbi:hypothetical protein INR49_007434 [Caranx melampygus]|nr:hypothetical protein INR49_007434 [Caranx melampygus]